MIRMIIGFIIVSIIIMIMYVVARITVRVIDPANKQPTVEQLILAAVIGVAAITLCVGFCVVCWALGNDVISCIL